MRKFFTLAFLFCLNISAIAQKDSLFLIGEATPHVGNIDIRYKKESVKLSIEKKHSIFSFADISTLKLADGSYYVTRQVGTQRQLLLYVVKGYYNLFYHEKSDVFYLETQDTLKAISKPHLLRVLPLLFSQKILDDFYKTENINPTYTLKYLTKLTVFANQSTSYQPIVFNQNIAKFKATVAIGPYAGIAFNQIYFALLNLEQKTPYDRQTDTDKVKSNSILWGIQSKVKILPKWDIELNILTNKISNDHVFTSYPLYYEVIGSAKILMPEKFDPTIKLTRFAFNTIQTEGNAIYSLRKPSSRWIPFLLAGVSVQVMTRNELTLAARFYNDSSTESYIYRTFSVKKNSFMFAFNGGIGTKYNLASKLSMNFSLKYSIGHYPKILGFGRVTGEVNNTPVASSTFGQFSAPYEINSYDQFYRAFILGVSVLYKL